ncbi:Hypothetical protein FKW44_009326, partial [Caligus rogercresseyi]
PSNTLLSDVATNKINKVFISFVMGRYNTEKRRTCSNFCRHHYTKRNEGSKIFTITLLFIISRAELITAKRIHVNQQILNDDMKTIRQMLLQTERKKTFRKLFKIDEYNSRLIETQITAINIIKNIEPKSRNIEQIVGQKTASRRNIKRTENNNLERNAPRSRGKRRRNRPFNYIRDLRQQRNYINEPTDIRLNKDSDKDDIFIFEKRIYNNTLHN